MNLLFLVSVTWGMAAFIMVVAWILSKRVDNYSIVDAVWALTFTILSPFLVVFSPGYGPRKIIIGALFFAWSLRLGFHLAVRIFRHLEIEDGRYQTLREEYGKHVGARFFLFFQMQALSIAFLLLPFLISAQNQESLLHPFEVFAVFIFAIGWIGESVADAQLNAFKRNPSHKGKVCDVGLWKYSRHPNYFFEAVIWLSFGVFALGSSSGGYAFLATGAMWFLLLKVTGVPYSEAQNMRSKPDAYREYQKRTNCFFLGPQRKT
jgi:steroid 5-alpha reductase family enzyme